MGAIAKVVGVVFAESNALFPFPQVFIGATIIFQGVAGLGRHFIDHVLTTGKTHCVFEDAFWSAIDLGDGVGGGDFVKLLLTRNAGLKWAVVFDGVE